jgi:hypothetical protein
LGHGLHSVNSARDMCVQSALVRSVSNNKCGNIFF